MSSDSLFYVVSPKDVIVARPRDLDDHISWLIEKGKYDDALKSAEENENELREHSIQDIGEQYILYLLNHGSAKSAAELTPKILKRDQKLWEKWVYAFGEKHEWWAICDYIPIANPQLQPFVYEMVLGYFMKPKSSKKDHEKFRSLIYEWPSTLYNIKNITSLLKKRLEEFEDECLMDSLAKL